MLLASMVPLNLESTHVSSFRKWDRLSPHLASSLSWQHGTTISGRSLFLPLQRNAPYRFCLFGSKRNIPRIKDLSLRRPSSRFFRSSLSISFYKDGLLTRRLNPPSSKGRVTLPLQIRILFLMRRLLIVFLLSSFLMGCSPASRSASPEPDLVAHTYVATDASILNPERGFFTPYELPGTPG